MTAKTARRQSRIAHLEALINHPRTPENERAAAIAMLKRITAKSGDAEGSERASQYARTYGAKYDHSGRLTTVDIAKRIREEIKVARKLAKQAGEPGEIKLVDAIGDAPVEIKISVRSQYYSGGSSIDITLRNIPADWGFSMQEDRWGYECEMPTPELRALAHELKAIMDGYNHNGSDLMTDYFDVRFYGHVCAEGGLILA